METGLHMVRLCDLCQNEPAQYPLMDLPGDMPNEITWVCRFCKQENEQYVVRAPDTGLPYQLF